MRAIKWAVVVAVYLLFFCLGGLFVLLNQEQLVTVNLYWYQLESLPFALVVLAAMAIGFALATIVWVLRQPFVKKTPPTREALNTSVSSADSA